MRMRVSRLRPCRRGSFHELEEEVVVVRVVVLLRSCVREEEEEVLEVLSELSGVESTEERGR